MSAFSFLKNVFGFSEEKYNSEKEQNEHNAPYINPFKKEPEPQKEKTAETAVIEEKQTEVSIDKLLDESIMSKILDVLNSGLPDHIKKFIDLDAEKQYVRQSFGKAFEEYTEKVKKEIESATKSQWQADRINLEQQSISLGNQLSESKSKNEELRNRISQLDRQKASLKEQLEQAENKAATAEAEREQYQLECKSLMNKLKVSSINENALNTAKEENETLQKENNELKAELLRIKSLSLSEKENSTKETEERIAALQKELEQKNTEIANLSEKVANTESEEKHGKHQEIIAKLQDDIKIMTDEIYSLKEQRNEAKEAVESYQDELSCMQKECEVKDADINNLQSTISGLEEKLESLAKERADKKETDLIIEESNKKINELQSLNNQLIEDKKKIQHEIADKQRENESLKSRMADLSSYSEQLKANIENAKETQQLNEEKLRQEIKLLNDKIDKLNKKNQKSKDNTLLLFADSENSYDGKSTKDENKRNDRRTVSAIDYSSDYSDWLMPTPPSEEIPINDEKETEEPAPASNGDKHNSPEQMRLF